MIRNATLSDIREFKELVKYQYDKDEIKNFDLETAIENHPLRQLPFAIRSKQAYAGIMNNAKQTKNYILPGEVALFMYRQPKHQEDLAYYDATPLTLFCGITRIADGNIREIGLNLHYFPPYARYKILTATFNRFRPYWDKFFNDPGHKANMMVSYDALRHIVRSNNKIAFGLKMYVPSLRGASWLLPGRLLATGLMTEGNFAKSTVAQVMNFWRRFH